MKRKIITTVICLLAVAITVGAAEYAVSQNPFKVTLNGSEIALDGYNIDGSTYFKLRDIADAVGGFEVGFEDSTITLTTTNGQNSTAPAGEFYSVGETWTVDGQWSLTIDSVTKTDERNEYADTNPNYMYWVEYTYTNLGYTSDFMDGLYLDIDTVVDGAGLLGDLYFYLDDTQPRETPVGATCKAKVAVATENDGAIKLYFSQYDGNDNKQTAAFSCEVN